MKYNEKPGVSVIIPAYNGESTLEMCITSVLEQDYEDPLEIIVVDDGSKDSTPNTAERLCSKVIKHSRNMGLATSINDGIRTAKFYLILILHQDCILTSKKWLSTMVSELLSDDTIAVVSSPTFIPDNVFNSYSIWEKVRTSWMHEKVPKMSHYKELNKHGIFDKCDLFRKRIFEDVGLFDDKHHRTFMEDFDMSARLRHANYGILYINVPVEHWDGWKERHGLSRSLRKMYEANSAYAVIWRRRGYLKTLDLYQRILEIGQRLIPLLGLIFLATPYMLFAIPLLLLNPVAWAIRIHRRLHNYKFFTCGFCSMHYCTTLDHLRLLEGLSDF